MEEWLAFEEVLYKLLSHAIRLLSHKLSTVCMHAAACLHLIDQLTTTHH